MGLVEAWGGSALGWFAANLIEAYYNFFYAITHPGLWLDWSDKEAIMRFAYYGGSVEFFFVVFTGFLTLTVIGMFRTRVMWGVVIGLEFFANTIGRFAAWAGLLMVLQQIVIVFMQRIFAASQISLGFGKSITFDVSWWSEELKLYNAMIVALCATYTFVQGGHVRVDLVYATVRYRTRKIIDMVGSLVFMMPMAVLIWMYGWFFMWRHLDHAQDLGFRQAGVDAQEIPHREVERGDHRLLPQRLQRLFPLQAAARCLCRHGLPAGGLLLLPLLPGMA